MSSQLMSSPQPNSLASSWILRIVACVLLFGLTAFTFPPGAWSPNFGLADDRGNTGQFGIHDFSSHLRMVRSRWLAPRPSSPVETPSLYSPQAHVQMMSEWTGQPEEAALPFAYSPTMVILLAPFTLFPDQLAYLLWCALGLIALLYIIRPSSDPWGFGLFFLILPITSRVFALGQTSPLSTAALFSLILFAIESKSKGSSRSQIIRSALVLWLLTAKPPLALVGGAILVARGNWVCLRVVGLALFFTGMGVLAVWPWLGSTWVRDYLDMVKTYDTVRSDPAFSWCLSPVYMANLRSVFFGLGFSDDKSHLYSWLLWSGSLVILTIASWLRKSEPRMNLSMATLLILAYQIFAPHVNITEEIHLYIVAIVLARLALTLPRKPWNHLFRWSPFLVILLLLIASKISSAYSAENSTIWMFWIITSLIGKAVLAFLILAMNWLGRSEDLNAPQQQ